VNVLIVDDHAIVRQGLKQILVESGKINLIAEADSGAGAMRQIREGEWGVVVLDISLPDRNGIEVLKQIKKERPKIPVLMLSMHDEGLYAIRALKAGASGYMNKESAPEELMKAVRKLLGGGRYVSPALAETLASDLSQDTGRPAHETLSDREFEVLRKIASGKTVGQIADELHLSVTTVSTYRARILEKMNMSTTAELMHYALRNHLVD